MITFPRKIRRLGQVVPAINSIIDFVQKIRPTPGRNVEVRVSDSGTSISAVVPLPATQNSITTDTAATSGAPPEQRSIERLDHGLQSRNFHSEESKAKVYGNLTDWLEVEIKNGKATGRIKAKKNSGAFELFVRVTDGTGNVDSLKDVRYLRLGKFVDDPIDPENPPAPDEDIETCDVAFPSEQGGGGGGGGAQTEGGGGSGGFPSNPIDEGGGSGTFPSKEFPCW